MSPARLEFEFCYGVPVYRLILDRPSGLLASPADTWAYELCSIAYVLLLLWARLSLVDAGRALAEKCEAPGLRRFGKLLLWIIPLASLLPLILRVVEVIQLAAPALLQPIYEKYSYEKVLTWRNVQESCVAALELATQQIGRAHV